MNYHHAYKETDQQTKKQRTTLLFTYSLGKFKLKKKNPEILIFSKINGSRKLEFQRTRLQKKHSDNSRAEQRNTSN